MTRQWIRYFGLQIETDSGTVDLSNLRGRFKVRLAVVQSPNAADILVTNISEAPAPAPAPADGDLASEYKRKSGRDLASDREKYPEHVGGWVEQFTGKKLDAGKGFDASRFDMQKGGSALRAFDPARMARIQANAAMGQGAFGIGGPVLVPPANSNTSVDMNQKTEITILGGGDPQATAREVAGAQDKVNGGLLRNMAGAVR